MIIYRSSSEILKVRPNDKDKCTKKLMGENTVSLTVERISSFAFQVGDYVMFAGEKYTLNVVPKVKRESGKFVYNLLFEGIEYELRKVQMLFYTANLVYAGGADFSLMGNAELQARVIVENLNRVQSGWTLGAVISTDAKNLTYSNNNCLEAINKIATEFNTEFWIGSDKTVNIGKRGDILPVTFQYGKNKGLYSITRQNVDSKDIVTRLYPFGSEQNLPKGYRNNAKRLQIEGDYIENNTALYGIIESSETFDDIKPERTGTITGIDASNVLKFSDSSMDFDLNEKDVDGNTIYLIPGTTAKIHFQTGALAGYEFELSAYDHDTKTFTLILFTNEVAYNLPNATLKPAVGDQYVILDIYMPQSYVDAAEAALLAKAQESLAQNSVPNVSYDVEADPLFIKNLGLTFKAGDYVHVTDVDIDIDRDIRITGIERNLVKTDKYKFSLADTVEPSLATQIVTTLQNQDIVLKMNKLKDPARARRAYKVIQELQNAIYDQDGYFDNGNIKPFSIETNMLSVGSKGQQFYTDCLFQANYLGAKNNILAGNGSLVHLTIEDTPRTWTITGISETITDDNLRYIFIKCLKVGDTGEVILSASQLEIDDGTYYNFFAGVLSSVIDNARQVSLLFGFTTINGRFIRTGRILSADGETYFDLDTGEIQGAITFKAGSSGYANITDKPDLSVYALQNYVDTVTADLQSQIDGNITSWFYAYAPTLANIPASNWTTDTEKDKHLGDLFYNTTTGYAYRFQKVNSVYSWQQLSDSDISAALAAASEAQDTADGKRRVFASQPTSTDVYDVGDLWANATYGTTYTNDLLKCKTAKAVGVAFDIAHWEKASKYTDDTAVDELQIGGRNLLLNSESKEIPGYSGASVTYTHDYSIAEFNATTAVLHHTSGGSSYLKCLTTLLLDLELDRLVSVSFYIKNTGSVTITCSSSLGNVSIIQPAEAKLVKWQGIVGNGYNHLQIKFVAPTSEDDIEFALWRIKLENGGKATDWTPAPEDMQGQIDEYGYLRAALAGSTEVEGGLVGTNVILLKDSEGNTKAGMSGLAADDVKYWAGSTYANKDSAPFQVKKDGTVKATNAEIAGKVTATSGTIGGFEIGSDRIGKSSSLGTTGNTGMSLYDSFLKFLDSDSRCALIGSNVMPIASGTGGALGYLKNPLSNAYGTNLGLIIEVTNALNNIAAKLTGDISCNGCVVGFKLHSVTPAANTIAYVPAANKILAKFSYSNSGICFPTRQDIARQLLISESVPFSYTLLVMCNAASSTNGYIRGRNTSISGMDDNTYPYVLSNDANINQTAISMGHGDVLVFELVWDGSTNYYAYTISQSQ